MIKKGNETAAVQQQAVMPADGTRGEQVRLERSYRLELHIGARMMLRFGWGNEKNSTEVSGELVGYTHYEFLLVRVQPSPGLLPRINQSECVSVRFLNEGAASLFQTSILGHISRPSLILSLAYPNFMNTLQIRRHKRVSCALPVIIGHKEQKGSGIINDLSRGGCRLIMDMRGQSLTRDINVGDTIELNVPLDLAKGLEVLHAVVKNAEIEQYRLIMGLAFQPMHSQSEQLLEAFLANTEILLI